ncbi:MAG: hypothetical protein JW958_10620 [Candidatus Eisenbacteria bacterium]|nr:hypothetical protein [Candidatus Eisenbacteria bacterium]
MREKRPLLFLAALLLFFALALPAGADTPRVMHYQGTLADTSGALLTGVYDLTFRLYGDSVAAGPVLWEEPRTGVDVEDGLFQVILGRSVAIPDSVIAANDLWLGLTLGADPELAPRRPIGSVFFAMRAGVADSALAAATAAYAESAAVAGALPAHDHDDLYVTEAELSGAGTINDPSNPVDWTKLKSVPAGFADGVDDEGGALDDGDWTIAGDDLYAAVPGKVGIGTAAPEFKLSVLGDGGLIANGVYGAGATLAASGGGTRLLFYPRKAAFRAGYVDGNAWDDGNIGAYSIALGQNARATGQASVALGEGAADGTASFAAGSGVTAAGAFSAALGRTGAALGTGGMAIGSFLRAGPSAGAMAIGSGVPWFPAKDDPAGAGIDDENPDSLVNDIENSLAIGFGDTTAALFVGGPENRVGVKTTVPAADLDVAGKLRADSLQIPTGATDGHVLTSDAAGNATWQPADPGGEDDGDWTVVTHIGPDDMIANVDGHVGIGADTPLMKLTLDGDGGIIAEGSLNNGVDLDSTNLGAQMLWYPRRAAFRAGEASHGSDWTDDYMGYRSVAFGDGVRVSGEESAAFGRNLVVTGDRAFAFGTGIDLGDRLTNAIDESFLIGFGDTTATFFVGGPEKRVGIGTTTPAADLDVAGTMRADAFEMPTGAANGYVFSSDAAGEGTWTSPPALDDGDWVVNGGDLYPGLSGDVGVGTSSPGFKLDVEGDMRVANPGGANGTLILRDSNGGNSRPGIRFEGNAEQVVAGDDAQDEVFYLASENGKNRSYDAILRVLGSAMSDWGVYTEVTHDGTDGRIGTDKGDLGLEPEGDVRVGMTGTATDLDVSGIVSADSMFRIGEDIYAQMGGAGDSSYLWITDSLRHPPDDAGWICFRCSNREVMIGPYAVRPAGGARDYTAIGSHSGMWVPVNPGPPWLVLRTRKTTCVGHEGGRSGTGTTTIGAYSGGPSHGVPGTAAIGYRSAFGNGDPPGGHHSVTIGYKAGRHMPVRDDSLVIANDSTINDVLIKGDFERWSIGIGPASGFPGTVNLYGQGAPTLVFNTGQRWHVGTSLFAAELRVGTGSALGQNERFMMESDGTTLFSGEPDGDDSSYVILNGDRVALRVQSVDTTAALVFSDSSYGLRSITQEEEALVGYSTNDRALFASSVNSYAAKLDGNVYVAGNLSKAGGTFLIDHPLDPENKLLRHSFTESPEHLLIYRGKMKLDGAGEGTVALPGYFEALAKEEEAMVSLTAIGRPFLAGAEWNARRNAFTVTGPPGREVAWMVTASRDDPVIRRLDRPTEEGKPPDGGICPRGRLLYPEAYGYPESKSRDYEERAALREGR